MNRQPSHPDHRSGTPPASPLTRRQFMASTATATTFAIMSPALAFGSEANSRVTAGVVGLGGRGGWVAEHVARHPGFQVTAVADYFPEVAQSVGGKLKVPKERCYS